MFGYSDFNNGKMVLSSIGGKNSEMLMDVVVYRMKKGEELKFYYDNQEMAILLVEGAITYVYNGLEKSVARANFFEQKPYCLHAPKGVRVIVKADKDSEIILQSTDNERDFDIKFYEPKDCDSFVSCDGKWENTAVRDVVTVFDYNNAPYSNMVIGEVYARQGRWWSYIPHNHPQPEVYYYRFLRPEGFGACFIGDVAHTVKDASYGCFEGGYNHPQVTAPGYPMYNVWMIRHLDGNPWTDRIDDPRYSWLLEEKK